MKKSILILIMIIFAAAGAFAQSFSISLGAGGLFDWSFNNGMEIKVGNDKDYLGSRNMSFGGFIFFDATYVELDASFAYGLLKNVVEEPKKSAVTADAGSMLQLGASLLLKYPLNFGKVSFFPLMGASYNMVLVAKDTAGNKLSNSISDTIKNFSQIGILGGAGLDFLLSGSLFLRIEALYQLRFPSKAMNDSVEATSLILPFTGGGSVYSTLGMGPLAKIGVGYRF